MLYKCMCMFASCCICINTCGWKTGKWLKSPNNGVEINIPRSGRFHFFEDDDNIVCLHWQRQTALSLQLYPKHAAGADTVSLRERKLTERFYPSPRLPVGGKHQRAGGCAPLPAHGLRLPFQRGPAMFINRLFVPLSLRGFAEWKEAALRSSLWPMVALWSASLPAAVGWLWAAGRPCGE